MPALEVMLTVEAPAGLVWATVRDFGDDSWTGVRIEIEGEGVGAVRKVAMPAGEVVERCERLDDEQMVLGWEILSGNPFPVSDYHGTITVRVLDDERCEMVWAATYTGASPGSDVAAPLERFLRAAASAVRSHVEAAR